MRKLSAPDIPGSFARYNVRLAPFTTWGVGGVAGTLFTPRNLDELVTAVRWTRDNAVPFYVLGGGSNVLISDEAIETPVILTTGIAGVAARVSGEFVYLDCMSGAQLKNVLSLSVRNGWSGLECAAGIPGTVGGAVAGNVGTSRGFVGTAVERITTVEEDGSVAEWHRREIDWAYRYCSLFADAKRVAHEVTFRLRVDDKAKVVESMKSAMSGRKSQPVASRTAGCVFRNSDGDSAGRLLDVSGCKGMSVGGARVSVVHANFIENDGNCTARDILILAEMCRKRVWDAFGTALDFEVKIFGVSEVYTNATPQ